MDHLSSEICQI